MPRRLARPGDTAAELATREGRLPTDGGFGVVDASNHEVRASVAYDPRPGLKDFTFQAGPVNRFVAEAGRPSVHSESVWPGGTSG